MFRLTIAPALLFIASLLPAAEPPVIVDSGIPVGAPEQVLPAGAAFHLRMANPGRTLEALDALIMEFVPQKAVPENLKPLLALPHPVLAFIGRQTLGAPLDARLLAQVAGVAVARPLALSLYVGPGGAQWVLSVPVADRQAFTGLLLNLTRPRSFDPVDVAGHPGWEVEGTNPDLPLRFTVLASTDTVYLCSDAGMAELLAAGGAKHLGDDPVFAGFAAGTADVLVGVSATPAHPLVQMAVDQLAHLPPGAFTGLRRQLKRGIGPDGETSVNVQLRMHTPFADLDQLLDEVEALTTAAAETLVPAWGKTLQGIDGASVALDLAPEALRATLTVQAAGVEGFAAQPLPLAEVRAALAQIPGRHLWLTASGRDRPAAPGQLVADWLDLAVTRLKAKGIDAPYLAGAARYRREREAPPELGAAVPWILTTSYMRPLLPPKDVDPQGWLAAIQQSPAALPDLEVFPRLDGDALGKLFSARAAVINRNEARWTTVLNGSLGDERWSDSIARFHLDPRPGKADRLVWEDACITRSGLFGYSQHELINRVISYAAVRGRLQFLQQVQGDGPCWLDEPAPAATALPPGLDVLLARVPAGADSCMVLRVLPVTADVIDLAGSLEQAVRRELDAVLAKATTAIAGNHGTASELRQALAQIKLPLLATSLNRDRQGGAPYLVLAGNLRYPRPALAPVLRTLLAGFLAKGDGLGGLVAWRSAEPGRLTLTAVQDPRALALLVRSTVDAGWDLFMADGDPQARLRQVLGAPGDGERNPAEEILLFNPLYGRPR